MLHLPFILGLVFASNLIIFYFFTFYYPFVAILRTRSFYGAEPKVQRRGLLRSDCPMRIKLRNWCC